MSRPLFVLLMGLLSCARNQGTVAPTSSPAAEDPPPPVVPDDATVANAPAEVPPEPSKPASEPAPAADAGFVSWERKDPAGEKKLYEWDKANLARMLGYWSDLACFRERVRTEGKLALGSVPDSAAEARFVQFRGSFTVELDEWQKQLFAKEPRVLETSKLIGHLLEAHELVANEYPRIFAQGDQADVEKADAWWTIVEAKTKKYTEALGGTWTAPVCTGKTKKSKKKSG